MKKVSVLLVVAMIVMVTGCGKKDSDDITGLSKSQLIDRYRALESAYENVASELESAKYMLNELGANSGTTSTITVVGDGTGRFTFNSVDSKIIFPAAFTYPNSRPIAPDGELEITRIVKIKPSNNWICRMNGASVELEQTINGISGTVKVTEISEQVMVDQLQSEVLSPWFASIPNSDVIYKDIFINNAVFGKQAEVPIMIDSMEARLVCGMTAYGSYAITYVFVYRGKEDATKNEVIRSIINTISIDGNKLNL